MSDPTAHALQARLEETAAAFRSRIAGLSEHRATTEARATELTEKLRRRWQRIAEMLRTRVSADGASRSFGNR